MSGLKRAFTLFELLLVLVLVTVMYGLFAQNFSIKKDDGGNVKLEKLSGYLSEYFNQGEDVVSLVCLDECKRCKVLVNRIDTGSTLNIFDGEGRVNAYIFDGKRLEKASFDDYHIDEYKKEKVCLKFNVYPNGSSDKMAVEYKNMVYLFENYLEDTKLFPTILEAQRYLEDYQLGARRF